MTAWMDKLNMRPGEKRLVVVIAVVVFIVLNVLFVLPHRNDLAEIQSQIAKSQKTLQTYESALANTNALQARLTEMQTAGGADVLSEELQLQRLVQSQALASSLQITRYDPRSRLGSAKTNQFFEDQNLTVDFISDGKALVDFLASLATGNSMIRVREMSLRPDSSGTKLAGSLLFVASYQKKMTASAPPVRAVAAAPGTNPPAPTAAAPPAPAPVRRTNTETVTPPKPPAKRPVPNPR